MDLTQHFASFESVWQGGFFAGDPLDPKGSLHGLFSYLPVPYAIVLACIRPYVGADTVALEIGPGRGAYTRALTPAREVWCVDALSAEHNEFWEYVGRQPNVHYLHVSDFSLADVPDGAVDYVFSYDALCHVPFAGIEAYAESMHAKLRPGAQCLWMVADYAKYRRFIAERSSVASELTSQVGRPCLRRTTCCRRCLAGPRCARGTCRAARPPPGARPVRAAAAATAVRPGRSARRRRCSARR